MANLSSAFGEITFKNKDKSDLAKFIYYFNKENSILEYSTYLNDVCDLSYDEMQAFVKEHAVLNEALEYEIKLHFFGTGRWCYTENLNWFFNFEDYKNNIPNYTELMLETKIDVHFIDEESGCNELYEYSASLHAKANNYDFKTCIENEKTTEYDYTVENLKKLCDYTDVYSIEDAICLFMYNILKINTLISRLYNTLYISPIKPSSALCRYKARIYLYGLYT